MYVPIHVFAESKISRLKPVSSRGGRFESYLVYPKDRFSCDFDHINQCDEQAIMVKTAK